MVSQTFYPQTLTWVLIFTHILSPKIKVLIASIYQNSPLIIFVMKHFSGIELLDSCFFFSILLLCLVWQLWLCILISCLGVCLPPKMDFGCLKDKLCVLYISSSPAHRIIPGTQKILSIYLVGERKGLNYWIHEWIKMSRYGMFTVIALWS